MNIHSQNYPNTTSKIVPGEVRKPTTLFEHFLANPLGCTSFPEFCRVQEVFPGDEFMAYWRGGRPNTLGMLVVLDGGHVVRSWGAMARTHIVECARIAVSLESIQNKHRRLIRVTRRGVSEVVKEWPAETKQS